MCLFVIYSHRHGRTRPVEGVVRSLSNIESIIAGTNFKFYNNLMLCPSFATPVTHHFDPLTHLRAPGPHGHALQPIINTRIPDNNTVLFAMLNNVMAKCEWVETATGINNNQQNCLPKYCSFDGRARRACHFISFVYL